MKNHQIRMDVIGNNISNVNTVGFKSGRANFQDVLYQTLKSAGTSTNPAQVGLGVSLAGISNNMSPGGLQSTGRTLDLAINGDGFFKVIDPGSGKEYYTATGSSTSTRTATWSTPAATGWWGHHGTRRKLQVRKLTQPFRQTVT